MGKKRQKTKDDACLLGANHVECGGKWDEVEDKSTYPAKETPESPAFAC